MHTQHEEFFASSEEFLGPFHYPFRGTPRTYCCHLHHTKDICEYKELSIFLWGEADLRVDGSGFGVWELDRVGVGQLLHERIRRLGASDEREYVKMPCESRTTGYEASVLTHSLTHSLAVSLTH